jgi:hypothetical protein
MNRRDFFKKSVIGSIILPFFGSKKETIAETLLKKKVIPANSFNKVGYLPLTGHPPFYNSVICVFDICSG